MDLEPKAKKSPNLIFNSGVKEVHIKSAGLCIRYGTFHRCHVKGLYCSFCTKSRKKHI